MKKHYLNADSICPYCDYKIDMAQSVDQGEDISPTSGDIVICFRCSQSLMIDENLKLKIIDGNFMKNFEETDKLKYNRLNIIQSEIRLSDRKHI